MDYQLFIVLFSKYSLNSKKLMNMLQTTDLEFQSLCIDNKNIRKKILESTKIKVNNVPCILIVYPNGGVEQYEGENSFKWVLTFIEKNRPVEQHIPQQPVIQQKSEEEIKPIEKKKKKEKTVRFDNKTNISELLDENENENENQNENENENMDDIISFENDDIQEIPKSSSETKNNSSSIMAAAMEMQKLREKESEKEKRQMPPPVLNR
jgi:hypothetical protein